MYYYLASKKFEIVSTDSMVSYAKMYVVTTIDPNTVT